MLAVEIVDTIDPRSTAPTTTDAVPALVGVDPALLSDRTETITIGGIQNAVLVPLVDDLWDRPGSIESMNGIVLGAAQADRLEARRLQRVRGWVWQGGNLALTGPRIDPLPVIGRPAEDGGRTAVGLGWVRFVGDAPEQARWGEAIEPVATRPSLQADGGGGWGFNDPSQGIGADLAEADASDSPVRIVLAFDGDHQRLNAGTRMMFELAETLTGEPPPFATLMYVWAPHAAPLGSVDSSTLTV